MKRKDTTTTHEKSCGSEKVWKESEIRAASRQISKFMAECYKYFKRAQLSHVLKNVPTGA
jgi:hypothetical protein